LAAAFFAIDEDEGKGDFAAFALDGIVPGAQREGARQSGQIPIRIADGDRVCR